MMNRLRFALLALVVFTSAALAQTDTIKNEKTAFPGNTFAVPAGTPADQGASAIPQSMNAPRAAGVNGAPIASIITRKSQVIYEAYAGARRILESENLCSRFFGGRLANEPLDQLVLRLETVFRPGNIGIRMWGVFRIINNDETGLTYRLFENEEVNRRGAFYNRIRFPSDPRVPYVGSFAPATPEARVLMLLHELGHMILSSEGKWLIPDDGNDAALSARNTRKIENECGAQIRSLNKNQRD
jgi:hypothetical protein